MVFTTLSDDNRSTLIPLCMLSRFEFVSPDSDARATLVSRVFVLLHLHLIGAAMVMSQSEGQCG